MKKIRQGLDFCSGKIEVTVKSTEKTIPSVTTEKKASPLSTEETRPQVDVNPITGLKERKHAFYKVPIVTQLSIGALKFNGQQTAVHSVPIGSGKTLDFFAKLGRSDELIVTFMGANTKDKNFYPRFSRVATFGPRAAAFMAFADPTLKLDATREMLLSWYLGGPEFDPAVTILKAIQKAKGKTGAKHVIFVGGSGGGFAALRLSSMVSGSMAYVQESATNIANSFPHAVTKYFDTMWPSYEATALLSEKPERFDMARHYAAADPRNYVYFAQSSHDDHYIKRHYSPFKDAVGVPGLEGISADGKRRFVLYKGTIVGHGNITSEEFWAHFDSALQEWRAIRQDL